MLDHMRTTRTATWLTAIVSIFITLLLALAPAGSAAAEAGASSVTVSDLTPKPTPTPSVEPKEPEPTPTPSVETPQLARTGVTVSGALIAVLVLVSTGLLARSHRNR